MSDTSESGDARPRGEEQQSDDDAVAIIFDPDSGNRVGTADNKETVKQMEAANYGVEWIDD